MRIAVIVCIGALLAACAQSRQQVDLLLVGGKVLTVNEKFSVHSAVAVKGGKILAVGGEELARSGGLLLQASTK